MKCSIYMATRINGWAFTTRRIPKKKRALAGLPAELVEQVPVAVTPRAVRDYRYQRILLQQRNWTTKLKRAQTALKKLRTRARYYERTLTVCGSKPEAK